MGPTMTVSQILPFHEICGCDVTVSTGAETQLSCCRFRNTDGRWYLGEAQSYSGDAILMKFLHPTKAYMLDQVLVSAELVQPHEDTLTESSEDWTGKCVLALDSSASPQTS